MEKPPAVDLVSVSKHYGATVALEAVSLRLHPGEIQALLGENGAGKSTLVKVLSGVVSPNSGQMTLDGQRFAPRSLLNAREAGVSTAFQELSLLPNLTVAQNLFLPTSLKGIGGLIDRKGMEREAASILENHDVTDIDPRTQVQTLTLAAKQRLEIVRALHRASRLLILDEPTGALADVEWLFRLIRRASAAGTAVLYISHRLAEIRELASSATVLRSGKSIATLALSDVSDEDIFEMMVGRSSTEAGHMKLPIARAPQSEVLVLNDLKGTTFDNVSLTLARGEILGIAALEGQGQRELFRTLAGQVKPLGGQIVLGGRAVHLNNPAHALRTQGGIAFVAEDRKSEGIFPSMSTAANMTQPILRRIARYGALVGRREAAAVKTVAPLVELSARYLRFQIGNLSGGNQQKALIGRALLTGAKTLLLFDPTRGVDVGTKEIIHNAIDQFVASGGSVLVYSTEIAELMRMSNRCLVMYGGGICADMPRAQMDERRLVALMTGNAENGAKTTSIIL